MNEKQHHDTYNLGELILLALDGKISPAEHAYLQDRIIHDPAARDYYLEFMNTYVGFSPYEGSALSSLPTESLDDYSGLLSELAATEKTAPAVPMSEPADWQPPVELIQKVCRPSIGYRFKRTSLWTIAAAAAVILLVVLFDYLVPARSGREVVTLTDSLNAKWADSLITLKPGARLMDSDPPFMLRQGYAALRFDNDAAVLIEAPAEFQVLSDNQIRLNYGQLYATVPDSAHGFTVLTTHADVVDLGTEFGIKESLDGETDIHVVKGRVNLTTELAGRPFDETLGEGLARQVSAKLGRVRDIAFNQKLFARRIDSAAGFVWKGRRTIDLADIVGGGNGRGTGRNEIGIDPLTGKRCEYYSQDRQGRRRYVPVPEDRYIDGVFVPDGKTPQVVSSQGHVFKECPPTSNVFYAGIFTGSGINLADYNRRPAQASLGGRLYGTLEYPSIFMHANLGITFDLNALRRSMPGFRIDRFISDAGLSSDAPRQGNVDVWVLVDGAIRYSSLGLKDKGKVISMDVPLKPSDGFLTLVVTDGRDIDRPNQPFRSTDSDWCVFGYPRLGLTQTNE